VGKVGVGAVKTVDELVRHSINNKITSKELSGGANYITGTYDEAKITYDKITEGWNLIKENSELVTMQSPDKIYQLTLRTVSSSAEDVYNKTGKVTNAVIEILQQTRGKYKKIEEAKRGIKFLSE
jgi:hypothetical protein